MSDSRWHDACKELPPIGVLCEVVSLGEYDFMDHDIRQPRARHDVCEASLRFVGLNAKYVWQNDNWIVPQVRFWRLAKGPADHRKTHR